MNKKILNEEILSFFLQNGNKQIHGREIARKLKANQKTVQNKLNKLVKNKILEKKIEGKNHSYGINKDNPLLNYYLQQTELNKTISFLNKHFEIKLMINEIKNLIKSPILIFGSYAKGYNKKDSDLDILILDNKKYNLNKIKTKYNLKVQLLQLTKQQFKKGLKNKENFPQEVLYNHIIIQNYEFFVNSWMKHNG